MTWAAIATSVGSLVMSNMNPKQIGGGSMLPQIDTSTNVQRGKKPSWLEIGTKAISPMLGGGGNLLSGGSDLFNLISQLAGKMR